MKKEFVPNEQALALKELGFDEQCLGYYDTEGLKISSDWYLNPQNKNSLFPEPHTTNNPKISAPLYQQAFRWFREKHNIYNIILPSYTDNKEVKDRFFYEVAIGKKLKQELEYHNTYEEAEQACLDKLIEICKNK
jgi:hypothetical protein